MSSPAPPDNRARLLASARRLLQARGFNAFSFRDLADAVGIKSASVHYHFPTKQDLGIALVRQYRSELEAFLDQAARRPDSTPASRIEAFLGFFQAAAAGADEPCLAGRLASDHATLGAGLQAELRALFAMAEGWLADQIRQAKPGREKGKSRVLASVVMSSLQGALLLGRALDDPKRVRRTVTRLIRMLDREA